MKLQCVLTACDENPKYIDFVPIFIKVWRSLYPSIKVIIILVAEKIPAHLFHYHEYIHVFPPPPGKNTGSVAQCIRLLYPAIIKGVQSGIMITDIDMLPLNKNYFNETISAVDENAFVYLRGDLSLPGQYAMCYNVATAATWGEVFGVNTEEDVREILSTFDDQIWTLDQQYLYRRVNQFHASTGRVHKVANRPIKRLDRSKIPSNRARTKKKIQQAEYDDFHCPRPMNQFREYNLWVASVVAKKKINTKRKHTMELVSIVIVSQGQHARLARAVKSVRSQNYPRIELIVVCNDSTDPWRDGGSWFGVRKLRVSSDAKLGAARGYGVQCARGTYVAFCAETDVWTDSGKLTDQIKAMKKQKCLMSCTAALYGKGIYHQSEKYRKMNEDVFWETISKKYRRAKQDVSEGFPTIWTKAFMEVHNCAVLSTVVIQKELFLKLKQNSRTNRGDFYVLWQEALRYGNCAYLKTPYAHFSA
jgi:hypothetical protein